MGGKSKVIRKKDRPKFDKVNALYKKDEGHWVTVNGRHMFVATDKKKR